MGEGKGGKRIEMYYVHAAILYNECDHYVLETYTNKSQKKKIF